MNRPRIVSIVFAVGALLSAIAAVISILNGGSFIPYFPIAVVFVCIALMSHAYWIGKQGQK